MIQMAEARFQTEATQLLELVSLCQVQQELVTHLLAGMKLLTYRAVLLPALMPQRKHALSTQSGQLILKRLLTPLALVDRVAPQHHRLQFHTDQLSQLQPTLTRVLAIPLLGGLMAQVLTQQRQLILQQAQ